MSYRRIFPLVFWLAIVVGTALGASVPAVALAHPGHGPDHSRATPAVMAADGAVGELAAVAAGPTLGANSAMLWRATMAAMPCGGAVCCSSGHGCCAAILTACPATGAARREEPPSMMRVGPPPGLRASAPAEPPRPVH